MKMIVAIVHDDDAHELMKSLTDSDFRVTKLATTGGFLRSGNTTLIIGVQKEKVDQVIKIIEDTCCIRTEIMTTSSMMGDNSVMGLPIEITVGGATVFVLDVEQNFKF